jgi:hypothetical protein
MTALNQPAGYVAAFASNAGGNAIPIPFTSVDTDYSEFSGSLQADAQSGIFTGLVDGVYELGCQAMILTNGGSQRHLALSIWTDAGAASIAPPGTSSLAQAGVYGRAWQRIAQKLQGTLGTNPQSIVELPGIPVSVRTVVCLRSPPENPPSGNVKFSGALPSPARFLFAIQADAITLQTSRVRGDAVEQTVGWMRWLGDPG